MNVQLERRVLAASRGELRVVRSAGGTKAGKQLVGYAAVYNKLSEELGGFREFIRPGAFTRCMQAGADVRALINHNPDLLIGRTRSGTLRLRDTVQALRVECDLPDTNWARDYAASIQRGDMSGMSFGFVTRSDDWSEQAIDGQRCLVRELVHVDLFDVSAVTYPAYPDTEVGLRSLEDWLRNQNHTSNDVLRRRLDLLALEV